MANWKQYITTYQPELAQVDRDTTIEQFFKFLHEDCCQQIPKKNLPQIFEFAHWCHHQGAELSDAVAGFYSQLLSDAPAQQQLYAKYIDLSVYEDLKTVIEPQCGKEKMHVLRRQVLNTQKNFHALEYDKGEDFTHLDLSGATFTDCYFACYFDYSDLSKSNFKNCSLKTTHFCHANLSEATIDHCSVESIDLEGANTTGLTFTHNYHSGFEVGLSDVKT